MKQNKIEKPGNLFVLENSVALDIPLNQSLKNCLISILGERYSDRIQSFLQNTSKLDLIHLTLDEVKQYGFTKATAKKVLGIIQFAITLQKMPESSKTPIRTLEDANRFFSYLSNETQEHLVALFLDRKNQMIARKTIFVGSLDSSVVHPRDIMREALKLSAASMIIAHNHVSGIATPSTQDIDVTKRLMAAGDMVGIPVLDHIIVGHGQSISLKDKGYVQ